MGRKDRIPLAFYVQIPRENLQKIIEKLEQIQNDIHLIEECILARTGKRIRYQQGNQK
jgi:tetrahydromethanopterin S-methyltransferase subunit G